MGNALADDPLAEYYEQLLGSRINDAGELAIPRFDSDDYEDLWRLLVEIIVIPRLSGRDFFHWLGVWAVRYGRHRNAARYFEKYDPLVLNRPEELNTRQQLAIIKFYMKKRRWSAY